MEIIKLIAIALGVALVVVAFAMLRLALQMRKCERSAKGVRESIEEALRKRDMESKNSKHWRVSTPAAR